MNISESSTPNEQKQCLMCEKRLPPTEFYSKGANRFEANCKSCSKKLKVKCYKMTKTVHKRKVASGKVQMRFVPSIENYLLKIMREL